MIDSHAHLDLIERPTTEVVADAGTAGVHRVLTVGIDGASCRAALQLARELDKPVVIHTRAADDDTLDLLAGHGTGLRVVLHCFSMPDRLDASLERGYWISFAGNATYPSAPELREAAARVPADRLLVETDSPFLAPQPVRGKPNEPRHVVATARVVAEARGVDYEELEAAVERNAAALFGW